MGKDFPFGIADVAGLLPIDNQRRKSQSIDADCPFCFQKRKFNMNIASNVFRCNYCGAKGGMLDLYMQFHPDLSSRSEAYHAISEALRIGHDGVWQSPRRAPTQRLLRRCSLSNRVTRPKQMWRRSCR